LFGGVNFSDSEFQTDPIINLHTGKISRSELDQAHPDLLDALIAHEGIGLVTTWLALQEALYLSKWRALFIPVVALLVAFAAIVVVGLVSSGAALTVETIWDQLGLAGQ